MTVRSTKSSVSIIDFQPNSLYALWQSNWSRFASFNSDFWILKKSILSSLNHLLDNFLISFKTVITDLESGPKLKGSPRHLDLKATVEEKGY